MDPSVIFRKILIFMCLEFICDKVNGNTPDHSSCAGKLLLSLHIFAVSNLRETVNDKENIKHYTC